MRKTKILFILFLIVSMIIIPFTKANAHTVELDPNKLISFPWIIFDGEGEISIDDEITGYTLYYQAVNISSEVKSQIDKIYAEGEKELDILNTEIDKLDAECDNLETACDEAFEVWKTKVDNDENETEIAEAETAYETARITYDNKIKEHNAKVNEYNTKVKEIENNINALIPTYVEGNWINTEDGSFSVDITQFSGDREHAIWVKLVCSDGTTCYDVQRYTMSGTKPKEIAVETITLDKSEVTIKEGSNYTLTPTIKPEEATNKLVMWTSEDEKIATVEDGKITAVAEGTTTITATTKDGEYTATCKVIVTKKDITPAPEQQPEDKDPDNTVAPEKIPNAGTEVFVILTVISLVAIVCIISYKKYNWFRDIK